MIYLILLLGLILRLISLNQSLWLDEATSVIVARDYTFGEIFTKFSPGDFHPPLYYLILKAWINIFGASEVAVRMMSVLFGILTIWVVYKIAKQITTDHQSLITPPEARLAKGGNHFPLLSALLLATAPLHIYYSQEARMYVLETYIAALTASFVFRIFVRKELKLRNFFGLIFVSTTLLYTDYLPIFLLVSFFAYLLIYQKMYLRYAVAWVGGVAILFLPWVPTFFAQFGSGLGVRESAPLWWATLGKTNLKELTLVPIKFIIGRISSYDKFVYGISVLVASVPFVIPLLNSFFQFSKTKFLWFWFLAPLLLAAIFGIFFSGFSYFRFLFVLPAFYLLVAYGALSIKNNQIKKWVVGGVVLINLVASGIYLFNPRFHREDWRSAVNYIEENSGNMAATVFVSKNQRDPYHYYAKSVPSFGPEGVDLGFEKLWLIRYVQPIFDPKDELRAKIENNGYAKVDEKDFNGVVVWQYQK